jgi:NagD protein
MPSPQPSGFAGYVFDLDGTVYLGERLLPGAAEALAALRRRGARIVFLSNKPVQRREAYAAKLEKLGIHAPKDDVINSSMVLAQRLAQEAPGARVFAIGETPLLEELAEAGLVLEDDPTRIEWVIASLDRQLDYRKLEIGYQALARGARFCATNPDKTLPLEGEQIPDCAAVIAALEACSGRQVEWIAGKPSQIMLDAALARLRCPPRSCLVVGDRLETDVEMGRRGGLWTAAVLTGVSTRESIAQSPIQPDFVCAGIHEIPALSPVAALGRAHGDGLHHYNAGVPTAGGTRRPYRWIMVGAGGMAGNWLHTYFEPHRDRIDVVAIVDVNPDALARSGDLLDVPPERRFTRMEEAFTSVEADCCGVAVPPRFHRPAVELAAARGLQVLSEKPIADTWEDSVAIYRAARQAGIKMQVMQNYRYTPRIQTLKQVLDSGRLGRINYVVARFGADYRQPLSWGAAFRHQMRHAMLVEGSIHHFDQIRHLAQQDCRRITGWEWNPGAPSFQGECLTLYTMQLTGGAYAQYEGSGLAAGWQNSWHGELYRVECEGGAVVLDRDHLVRIQEHERGRGLRVEEVPTVRLEREGHVAVIGQFLDWLDGGPAPPTAIEDNIKSTAMLFAAIDASATSQTVDVTAMLAAASA